MLLAKWWSRLTGAECGECGHPQSVFARNCVRCGAANRARTGAIAVAAALGVLLIAALVAISLVIGWERTPGEREQAAGDFGWLTKAMQDCDAVAAKEPDTVHFLVIPLAVPKDDEQTWRGKALNTIGHGILLRSEVAMAGLTEGALSISKETYVLSVRDQAKVVYSFDASVSVQKFSIPNAAAMEEFSLQFQYGDNKDTQAWGNTFNRVKGNCYWVNVILAN